MVRTSKKGGQGQDPETGITPSPIEAVIDVHESFEDMLSDFGKLQLESPKPIIEHQTNRDQSSEWTIADESCTTYQIGSDLVPWWEVDEQVRRAESSTIHVAIWDADKAAFDDPIEVMNHATGDLLATEEFPGLDESIVLADQASQSTTSSEWETTSPTTSPSSDETEVIYTAEPLCSGNQLPDYESVLDLGSFEQDLPTEQSTFVLEPSRELITKPDGSRFFATGMHHLTAYKPSQCSPNRYEAAENNYRPQAHRKGTTRLHHLHWPQ